MQLSDRNQPGAEPLLRIAAASHRYGERLALDGVGIDVFPGRVTMLLGPNGAGKTTLFSLIARLLPLQTGAMRLCGEDLVRAGDSILARMGIVFQQPTLDLDLTVAQNLSYYAALHGLERNLARARMGEALGLLDLTGRARDKVRDLNGGHRRRVEIARVLMTKPRLLLLDEPTVGLDIPARRSLVAFLHRLAVQSDIAILWATHLIDEVDGDDDLIILAKGRVRHSGRAATLLAQSGEASLSALFQSAIVEGASPR